jgi:hypothetical protein
MGRGTARQAWRNTLWEIWNGATWRPLPRCLPGTGYLLVSAYNPRGLLLGPIANRDRDLRLRDDLERLGILGLRARGRSAHGSWCEKGWLVPHAMPRSLLLLARHRQLAALLIDARGRHLVWGDGLIDPWPR